MAEVRYTPRLEAPGRAIERGRNQIITCPVYAGSTLTAPSSGTCTISSPTATVSTGAISVVSTVAEYTVTAADLADQDYGSGWSIDWALTMPDSAVHTFREEAALCRTASQQRVAPVDLYRREPYLDPASGGAVWSGDGADQCLEAHLEVEAELWVEGKRPYLIVSQNALARVELLTALRMVFEALSSTGRESFGEKARIYSEQARAAWRTTTLRYDLDGDGRVDADDQRRSARPSTVWLGSTRRTTWP